LGVPKRVEEITDVNSLKHAHAHILERVENGKRRECIGCKIRGRPSRLGGKQPFEGRLVLGDIITKEANKKVMYAAKAQGKCAQCNVHLCVYGECWDIYHRTKKFS
jgi:hypothetical protein